MTTPYSKTMDIIKNTKLASEFCPDVSLKSINHNRNSSHDTHHFSAQLYLKGKNIMRVQNEGRGGDNYYDMSKACTNAQVNNLFDHAESFCKRARRESYDKIVEAGSEPFAFVDLLVGSLLNEYLTRDEMRKQLNQRMYVIDYSQSDYPKLYGVAKRATSIHVEKTKEIEPELTILNEFNEDTQLKLWLTIN